MHIDYEMRRSYPPMIADNKLSQIKRGIVEATEGRFIGGGRDKSAPTAPSSYM